ncbi:putative Methyl-CpG-binding domain-containing protein [Helianthus debilis subsp. tardiflorus]
MSPVKSPEEFGDLGVGKQDKIVVDKDEAEELPPGWTKEVKLRKTGSATKIDRYYTDPVTGYIFHSLKDVQRYLKTGKLGRLATKPKIVEGEDPTPEPKTRQATRLAEVAVDVSPSSQSPPEPKTRKATRLAGLAVDASLSSPEPKTRQATRLAGVVVNVSPSPPEPKTRHTTRLAEVVDASLPSPSQPEPKTRQATRLDEMAVDAALPSPSPPDTSSNHQSTKQPEIKIDTSVPSLPSPSPPEPKTRQATPLKRTEISPSPPSQPEPKTRQAKRATGIRDNASPSRPKTRRATEQAGIKINSTPPSPPDARTSRQATRTKQGRLSTPKEIDKNTEAEKISDKHNDNADMDIITPPSNQESNEKQEPHIISPPVTPKEHNKQIETGPTTSQPPEAQPPPTVVPLVNIEKQESPVVNPMISNPVPQDSYNYGSDMKPDSSINFSMNDLWTDPCIEFAVKTLTGAIPFTDLNKVENFTAPAEVPLDFWTDPCIEFAVKTLTGAIPVGEDDYLLHRPASSSNPQGLHNFSSPMNVCQTGHKNKQQDSVFTTLGNSGLQKSGKFVNGDYGQCSRSRFFQ